MKHPWIVRLPHVCFPRLPLFLVYYESIKWKLNKRLIFECRCDTGLKDKDEGSTRLTYTTCMWRSCCLLWIVNWGIYTTHMSSVGRGTGTPKDRDEVNRRDVCEWDGWVCVLDVIGTPSILRLTRKDAALARVLPTLTLSCGRNTESRKWKSPPLVDYTGCTPETEKKWSVSQWVCKNNNLMNSLCKHPDVLVGVFVYYESIKWKLNRRLIYECRCDERLKGKDEGSMSECVIWTSQVHRRYSK